MFGYVFYESGLQSHDDALKDGGKDYSEKEFKEAESWFKKAAEKKHSASNYALGQMRKLGYGDLRSNLVAAEYFFRAGLEFNDEKNREMALKAYEELTAVDKEKIYSDSLKKVLFPGLKK